MLALLRQCNTVIIFKDIPVDSAGIFIALISYFWRKLQLMKTWQIILLFAAAFVALFEQSKAKPNMLIMIACIVVFMVGLMRLMSKIPDKNDKKEDDEV